MQNARKWNFVAAPKNLVRIHQKLWVTQLGGVNGQNSSRLRTISRPARSRPEPKILILAQEIFAFFLQKT